MTGEDARNIRRALGLTKDAMAQVLGCSVDNIVDLEAHPFLTINFLDAPNRDIPDLAADILAVLWRETDALNYKDDACRAMGVRIAKDMVTHGTGHAVWRILNRHCARMDREDVLSCGEKPPYPRGPA